MRSASSILVRPNSSPNGAEFGRQRRDDARGPTLRTMPVTTHLPLAKVPSQLTSALIKSRGRAALRGLQRNFGNRRAAARRIRD